MAVAMACGVSWAKNYTDRTYDAGPSYLLYWAGWPVMMFLTGWTVLELAGSFLGAKRPKGTYLKWVRWVLIGLLLCYGVVTVPFLVQTVQCSLSLLRTGSGSFRFPWIPGRLWLGYFAGHPGLFRACFALIGAGLWLTRREKHREFPSES